MNNITSITTVFEDGTIITTSGPFTPVVAPVAAPEPQVITVPLDTPVILEGMVSSSTE